ncbi:hypothetical protein HWV62_25496 [Athelia sp. TMB]|nr:hypothetical protein HWV62_25496 [Athelia sp. TMB]
MEDVEAKRSDAVTNQIAPIALLPTEILSAVFEDLHASQEMSIPFAERCEVIVSHVSAGWRAIAIGTPSLWTRIQRKSFQRQLDSIEAYLRRSKTLPIDLFIAIDYYELDTSDWEVPDVPPDRDDTRTYDCLIKSHLPRCRHISIKTHYRRELIAQLNLLSAERAPFLQSMDLSCSYPFDDWELVARPDVLSGGAPCLNALRSLARLSCKVLDSTRLSHVPNLTHLTLDPATLTNEVLDSTFEISLPQLLTLWLQLKSAPAGSVAAFLTFLSAPLLEALHLGGLAQGDIGDGWTPAKFPALHVLVIDWGLNGLPEMYSLAASCPYITHLGYVDNPEHILEPLKYILEPLIAADFNEDRLASGHYPPAIWKCLHTLALTCDSGTEHILAILSARKNAGAPIKKLLLRSSFFAHSHHLFAQHVEVEDSGERLRTQKLYPSWERWNTWRWKA